MWMIWPESTSVREIRSPFIHWGQRSVCAVVHHTLLKHPQPFMVISCTHYTTTEVGSLFIPGSAFDRMMRAESNRAGDKESVYTQWPGICMSGSPSNIAKASSTLHGHLVHPLHHNWSRFPVYPRICLRYGWRGQSQTEQEIRSPFIQMARDLYAR